MSEFEAYRGLFIAESRENHENLVKNLLILEKSDADAEAIGEIFRSVHTLKGSSASMGFTELERLCHTMEDVFHQIRAGSMGMSLDLGNLLLSCSDLVEQMLDDIETGGDASAINTEELVRALKSRLTEGSGQQKVPASSLPPACNPAPPAEKTLQPGPSHDKRPQFDITVTVSPDCLMKDIRAMLVLNNLELLGTVISSKPPREEVDEGKFSGTLQVRIATEAGEEALKAAASVSEIQSADITAIACETPPPQAAATPRKTALADAAVKSAGPVQDKGREVKNLRVDVTQLDHIMNLVEELVINRGRLKQIGKKVKNKELDETISMIGRTVSDLQGMIMTIRMIPLNHIFNRLPRVVRDVAQHDGKEVEFIMEGGETELDRSVMDGLNDPLLHLIRNAVNHGIESPERRELAGKPRKGSVRLSAHHDRDNVVIELRDDGAGINVEKVKAKAVEKGLLSKETAETLSTDDAIDLLFQPGFSTADTITDISGRGVGLDVVRRAIENLKGSVRVETTPGVGSRFELLLPPTMAIVDVMLVRVNNKRIAIPLSSIIEVTNFQQDSLHSVGDKDLFVHRDEVLQYYSLDTMFGKPASGNTLIIVQYQKHKCCIPIDIVEGQQEVVVKPMSVSVGSLRGINGITILGDGDVVPVFDVNTMM